MVEEEIKCPLCSARVDKETFYNHFHAEKYVLDVIAQSYPEWKEEDGTCKKCLDYYMTLGQ